MIKELLLNAEDEIQVVAKALMAQAIERHEREALPLNWVEASGVFAFTVAERIRLSKLLRRWSILRPDHDLLQLMRDEQVHRSRHLERSWMMHRRGHWVRGCVCRASLRHPVCGRS